MQMLGYLASLLIIFSGVALGQTSNYPVNQDSLIVFINGGDCLKCNSSFFNILQDFKVANNVCYRTNLTSEEIIQLLPQQSAFFQSSNKIKFSVNDGFTKTGFYNKNKVYLGQSYDDLFRSNFFLQLKEDFFFNKFSLGIPIFTKGNTFIYSSIGFVWFNSTLNSTTVLDFNSKSVIKVKPDSTSLKKFYSEQEYLKLNKYAYVLKQLGMNSPTIEAVNEGDSGTQLFIGIPNLKIRNNKLQLEKRGYIIRLFDTYSDTLKVPENFIIAGKEYYIDPVSGFSSYGNQYFFVAQSRRSNKAKVFKCNYKASIKQFVDFQLVACPSVALEMKDINEEIINIDNEYLLNKVTGTYVKLPKDFKPKNWNIESVFKTENSISVILKSENKVKVLVQAFDGKAFTGKVFVSNYTFPFVKGPFLVTHTNKGKLAVFNQSEIWY